MLKASVKEFRELAQHEIKKFKNVKKISDNTFTFEAYTKNKQFELFNVYYTEGRYRIENQENYHQMTLYSREVI